MSEQSDMAGMAAGPKRVNPLGFMWMSGGVPGTEVQEQTEDTSEEAAAPPKRGRPKAS